MTTSQQLATSKEESKSLDRTRAGKYFTPAADIFETKEALLLVLDMPGVAKDQIDVRLENDLLEIEGSFGSLRGVEGYEPVYSEYNVGNYYRRFTLSNKIAKDKIEARVDNGVLTLTLPKVAELAPRKVTVN